MGNIILHSTPLPELRAMIGDIIEEKLRQFKPEHTTPSENPGEYLSRKEVCQLLKISMATLHYYTKDGILNSYKIGGRVLYKASEVQIAVTEVKLRKYKHCTSR
jgi:excisionase family DNA binding protein